MGAVYVEGDWASMSVTGTAEKLLTLPVIAVCEFRQDAQSCQREISQMCGR